VLVISISLFKDASQENRSVEDIENFVKFLRQLNAGLAFILLLQISYLAQLYPNLAPLVTSIFNILDGIVTFTSMLLVCVIAFAFSFFLLGLNQIEYDSIRPEDPEQLMIDGSMNCVEKWVKDPNATFFCRPMYADFLGSLQATWLIALGDFSASASFS
jgi:hypothetical protein